MSAACSRLASGASNDCGWTEDCQAHEAGERKPDWPDLVSRISAEEPDAVAEFYLHFQPGIRFLMLHYLGPEEVDDRVHDVIVAVIQAIKAKAVQCPERLPGFVRAVAKNKIRTTIRMRVRDRERSVPIAGWDLQDRSLGPEEIASRRQKVDLVMRLLLTLPALDREILTRFYVEGQSKEQICEDLGLTPTQFRLRKSNAKARITNAMR